METEFKVPSDLPTDPVEEGDTVDSPIPAIQDQAEQGSDEEVDDADGDDADAEDEDSDDETDETDGAETPE